MHAIPYARSLLTQRPPRHKALPGSPGARFSLPAERQLMMIGPERPQHVNRLGGERARGPKRCIAQSPLVQPTVDLYEGEQQPFLHPNFYIAAPYSR